MRGARATRLAALLLIASAPSLAADRLDVAWHPARPRVGDVAWLHVKGVAEDAAVEGSVAGRPLTFFPYAGGRAALVGLDLDMAPGAQPWRVEAIEPGGAPRAARGRIQLRHRTFSVQHLTLDPALVDLDPATEQRALAETRQLTTLYRTITPERLWRGRFTRPVAGTEPGTGFGARRVINGQPRSPHGGLDYAAPRGTPVVAANSGRIALVADFFFPGRLVVLDHGLGLYTLYFHLDAATVAAGQLVGRGETIGTVGATGRATGPHLHFGAQVGGARVDPVTLLDLALD